MDLIALQNTLRRFAAERAWEPFHTPKNLAMALVVEAAELAEVFQWLTPEQSGLARGDAVLRERVADELADVLLYLTQIADHTGVDLEAAVASKLVKNARKYPPVRAVPPLAAMQAAAGPSPQVHVLVDWENVQPKESDVRALVPEATHLWLFHGPSQKNVGAQHTSFGEQATPVRIARAGKNSLDFHLSFDLGYLAARQPGARFVVISNDKGYAPMLEHARQLGFDASQVSFGGRKPRAVAAKTPAAKKVAARKSAKTAKPAAAKKVAAPRPAPAKAPAAAKRARTAPAAAAKTVRAAPTVPTRAPARGSAPAPAPSRGSPPAPAPAPARKAKAPAAKSAKRTPTEPTTPVQRVRADLAKMSAARRPSKQARLLAYVGSQLGSNADDPAAQAVLAQLLADGSVSVNGKGELQYRL